MSKIMNKLLPHQTLFRGTLNLIFEADAALNNVTTAVAQVVVVVVVLLLCAASSAAPSANAPTADVLFPTLIAAPMTTPFNAALSPAPFGTTTCTLDAAISPAPFNAALSPAPLALWMLQSRLRLHAAKLPIVFTLLRSHLRPRHLLLSP
jgi:hypothetical protein